MLTGRVGFSCDEAAGARPGNGERSQNAQPQNEGDSVAAVHAGGSLLAHLCILN